MYRRRHAPEAGVARAEETYIAHLATTDESVLRVSASDKLHNARAIVTDVRRHGAALFKRFSVPVDETLWYYRSLVTAFAANPAHEPALIAELERVVTDMEHLARTPDEPDMTAASKPALLPRRSVSKPCGSS